MNPEIVLIEALSAAGIEACAEVPEKRPEELVSVEMTACSVSSVNVLSATFAVQCWAPSRYLASELAASVVQAAHGLAAHANVARCDVQTAYNFPDEHGQPRYQVVLEAVMRP